ncbi:unnamed protein product, partial [Prorocentrum cordatum]
DQSGPAPGGPPPPARLAHRAGRMAGAAAGRDACAELPSIVRVNRAHLPLAPSRYLAALRAELEACGDCEHQVRMLLREPLLLHAVAVEICQQRAAVPPAVPPAGGRPARSAHMNAICCETAERCRARARARAAEGTFAD